MGIRDTRMIQRAFESRWDIRPEYRDVLVKRLVKIIADPNSSPREVTAASKALIAAEAQNQSDQHKVIDVGVQQRNLELDSIAAELGIEAHLVVDAQRESGKADS